MPRHAVPKVLAFDVIETLAPLDPVAAALDAEKFPPHAMLLFFARLLRDAFALEAAATFRPFLLLRRSTCMARKHAAWSR